MASGDLPARSGSAVPGHLRGGQEQANAPFAGAEQSKSWSFRLLSLYVNERICFDLRK